MITSQQITTVDSLTRNDLKALAASAGPCLTIALPASNLGQFRVRLHDAIRSLEEKVSRDLLEPLSGAVPEEPAAGLILMRAPDVFHRYRLWNPVRETIAVGDRFEMRPLIAAFSAHSRFYLLALSQKHVRLLRCTEHSADEAPLPASTPTNLEQSMQTARPDHVLDNRSTSGPSTGSMKGVLFGTSTGRESRDEYLFNFFRQVDRGVQAVLREEGAPLVVAAVEYELALYHRASSYPHLVEDGVRGAPDGLKGGEMHSRALELMRNRPSEPLAQFRALSDSGRASSTIKEVIRAAYEGRVAHLFLRDGAEYRGDFDEIRRLVKRTGDEDLLNEAAIETLLHGGEVAVLGPDKIPNGAEAAAVFRY